jgi:hypothetical protein
VELQPLFGGGRIEVHFVCSGLRGRGRDIVISLIRRFVMRVGGRCVPESCLRHINLPNWPSRVSLVSQVSTVLPPYQKQLAHHPNPLRSV